MITRRQLVSASPLLLFPSIARGASWFSKYPFSLGVASGDPAPDGFVIWTRLAPQPFEAHGGMPLSTFPVSWEVAEDARFQVIAAKGETVARPELGHSVHVEVEGLQPDRRYWYRFKLDSDESLTGSARTLPAAGSPASQLRFGVCGCQHYEYGHYTAFRKLAQEDLAFVFHYGDFIYEEAIPYAFGSDGLPAPKVREHRIREVYSLDDYRAHYAQYLLDMDLQSARSRHAFLSTFDDHEVDNNWVGNISQDADVPSEVFALRRQAAMQAWYEHMPVRKAQMPNGPLILANRRLRFGDLTAINLLDTRSFRSDQPCGDGVTAPCPEVFSKDTSVLGTDQEAWLDGALARADTTWNCVAQQIMVMPLEFGPGGGAQSRSYMDSWNGYDEPRKRLVSRLRKAGNAVVLTGDVHQNVAGLLHDGEDPAGVECVVTSISSPGGQWGQLRSINPHIAYGNSQRGYAVCDVSPEAWQTSYRVLDTVTEPNGTLSTDATVTVPRDRIQIEVS